MPRHDGMPTNQEMLTDFTTTSRDLLVILYDKEAGKSLPPLLDGKSLHHIGARITKQYFADIRPMGSMQAEDLYITTLDQNDVTFMEEHFNSRELPNDTLTFYHSVAQSIATIALKDTLNLSLMLPPNGVVADYAASFSHYSHQVNTFSKKPLKQTIASARYFAEEVQNYVAFDNTDVLNDDPFCSTTHHLEDSVLTYAFALKIDPQLPLNGYEGVAFLSAYRDAMKEGYTKWIEYVQRLQTRNEPEEWRELALFNALQYSSAASRAQLILDQ